jgi:hypothetical protein
MYVYISKYRANRGDGVTLVEMLLLNVSLAAGEHTDSTTANGKCSSTMNIEARNK